MKDFQSAIIRMHENGYSERQIAEILSISKSTVHDDSALLSLGQKIANFKYVKFEIFC